MHEFHLMGQVVNAVADRLRGEPKAKPVVVRLKIQASSHLLAQDPSLLLRVFALAGQGTKAEGATLEIIPVPQSAWCPQCERDVSVTKSDDTCPSCRGPMIAGTTAEPEVVIHEVVVEE